MQTIRGVKMLSKKEFGSYLEHIRKLKKISLRDVYAKKGISYSHLSMIENGKRNVTPSLLKNLADLYEVDYFDLYEKAGYIDLIDDTKKSKYQKNTFDNIMTPISIFNALTTDCNYLVQKNCIGNIYVEKSLVGNGLEYFALKVKCNSMAPIFIEDDIVIIHKQNDFKDNDLVVAVVNNDEYIFCKVTRTNINIILQPFNSNYESIVYDNSKIPMIVGVIKQLRREFL